MASSWLYFSSGNKLYIFFTILHFSTKQPQHKMLPIAQDPPRDDTKDTIEKTQELGLEVKMITGKSFPITYMCLAFRYHGTI